MNSPKRALACAIIGLTVPGSDVFADGARITAPNPKHTHYHTATQPTALTQPEVSTVYKRITGFILLQNEETCASQRAELRMLKTEMEIRRNLAICNYPSNRQEIECSNYHMSSYAILRSKFPTSC